MNFNYAQESSDTSQINLLLKSGKQLLSSNSDSAKNIFKKVIALSSKTKYYFGEADSYVALGFIESKNGNKNFALEYYNNALVLYDSLLDKQSSAAVKFRIGSLYNTIGDYTKALMFLQKSLEVIEKGGNKELLATVVNNIGLVHYNFMNDDKAIEYYLKAYNIRREIGDKMGMAVGLFNIANIYLEKNDYSRASEYYSNSLKISEEINDSIGIAYCYLNIGVLNQRLGKNELALAGFDKAKQIQQILGDQVGLANTLIYLGLLLHESKEYSNAEKVSREALEIAKNNNLLNIERDANINLSRIYESKNDFKNAFLYFKTAKVLSDSLYNSEKSMQVEELETKYQVEKKQKEIELLNKDKKLQSVEIREQKIQKFGFIAGFILVLFLLIFIYRSFRIKHKANKLLLEKNIEIEQKNEEIISQAELLTEINKELEKLSVVARETDNSIVIFDANGKPEWVNAGFTKLNGYTLEEFIQAKGDNLFKMSSVKEIPEIVHSVVTQKKVVNYMCMITTKENTNVWVQTTLSPVVDANGNVSKIIAIDSDITKLKLAEEEIKQQKEEIEAQRDEIEIHRDKLSLSNEELAYKNKQIIDSITYAQLIQEALLPDVSVIRKHFEDFFIFFKPRNIVSGDFYWFYKEENKLFFAVADCTGHGVPGAFMSMIGTTLLNEIVKSKKIQSPSQILTWLNLEINIALKQQDEIQKSQGDGMDISFLVYDLSDRKLTIAMANQTIIIKDSNKNISLIKGDIYSVGGFFGSLNQTTFKNHEFIISEPVSLYLFTDGIKDQFNSNDEKFGEERLKSFFESLSEQNMDQQCKLVMQTFDSWKNNSPQIDDVLVAGIKLS